MLQMSTIHCLAVVLVPALQAQVPFLRGDVNGDGEATLADALTIARSVEERSSLPCLDAADVTDNGLVNLGDTFLLFERLLKGETPPPPFASPSQDPTEDSLGCEGLPATAPAQIGAYSLTIADTSEGFRLRLSLENPEPVVGGFVTYRITPALAPDAGVVDVRPHLEITTALSDDGMMDAMLDADGNLRILWLLSAVDRSRALAGGPSRPMLDVILCSGSSPKLERALGPSGPGELVNQEALGRWMARTETGTLPARDSGICPARIQNWDTVRAYHWSSDAQARPGEAFRVAYYGAANVDLTKVHIHLTWDPDVLRAIGMERAREETKFTGSWGNYEGYDSHGVEGNRKIEGSYFTLHYCEPCNAPRELAPRAHISLRNYFFPDAPERPFSAIEEYHHGNILFQVLPGARTGETRIEYLEDPTTLNGPDNWVSTFPGSQANVGARIPLNSRITVLPPEPHTRFIRGDADLDSGLSLTDAVVVLGVLFLGSNNRLLCPDAADANDDGVLDLSDPVQLLSFLFLGREPPPPPFPDPGKDPTEDRLSCEG